MSRDWRVSALCTQTDPEIFFPETGRSKVATRICDRCPARVPCGTWAVEHRARHGIWAGTSPRALRVAAAERDAA